MFFVVIIFSILATLYWFAPPLMQQIQQTNIDAIQKKIKPSHEIWREYDTLKNE